MSVRFTLAQLNVTLDAVFERARRAGWRILRRRPAVTAYAITKGDARTSGPYEQSQDLTEVLRALEILQTHELPQ